MTIAMRHGPALRTWFVSVLCFAAAAQDKPTQTGPETEQRFPPLKVPPGFKATLFACDPLIEYPSAVALGPRSGSIFVAADYLTGLGTEIVRRDEIRLVEDTDRDGYADRVTRYAAEFNSIQGLTYHDGTVYVMHAPFLTALRDRDLDGKADEHQDLVAGLGLPPEENPVRLHCANGVAAGHDGWLYLALGDHGCDVTRPEGDRLVLQGGGILRCRPDGRDLHIFATGLRNIYDVALDEDLNVFVRDNENDGGDYKIRVCHSFFGADHGYPYLYSERPEEALPPLADLGLGSSAGGLCYLEPAFPAAYRGNLFFCEWGRAVVRYCPVPSRSGFAPVNELEFAAAAENDPYGFKPTDLIVEREGSLIVSDWADGQRPKRGRGRIYRIRYAGDSGGRPSLPSETAPLESGSFESRVARLNLESFNMRLEAQSALEHGGPEAVAAVEEALGKGQLNTHGRLHAVWILARRSGGISLEKLFNLAQNDPVPRVRAQAVRAISDLADPMFEEHRLAAGRGDQRLAARLAALASTDSDDRVRLEVVIAVGRLRWAEAPGWLRDNVANLDSTLAHAAIQTLRRSENWSAVLKLLDEPEGRPIRALALRAIADRAEPVLVDGLIERLGSENQPSRRREYAGALTRVHRKPGPWTYWGYRPAPRPPNSVAWEKTVPIEEALDRLLVEPDSAVRLAVLRRMQREKIPARPQTLDHWLRDERDDVSVGAILESLSAHPGGGVREPLTRVIVGKEHTLTNRLAALSLFANGLDATSENRLLELAGSIEDGPVLAAMLQHAAKRPKLQASSLLLAKLNSNEPAVRAASLEALAELQVIEASDAVRGRLEDQDARVRLAAASAAGALRIHPAADSLLSLAKDADPALRRASLESLRLLREPRSVPLAVAALEHRETQLTGVQCLSELGGAPQLKAILELARRDPSAEILSSVARLLEQWLQAQPANQRDELNGAVAELHGATGSLLRWQLAGPFLEGAAAAAVAQQLAARQEVSARSDEDGPHWRISFATGAESRVSLGSNTGNENVWLARTDLHVSEPTAIQFLASMRGEVRIWLNGQVVQERTESRSGAGVPHSFDGRLKAGANRVLVQISAPDDSGFSLRFRGKSSAAEHERLAQAALSTSGNPQRGRKLFFDAEKSQCLKCHRLTDQGEQIGPELTGIGSRFSRIHIIESILEPSRSIAPSFQTAEFILDDGREFSGILLAEKDGRLTLADSQGQKHVVARSAVRVQRTQSLSAMPEGLERGWTTEEFIDLVAFLVSQKQAATR
ncbi:MAG: c-type cytochrome [Verrucomicrobia bacterium]|nr:c-type cytochrome [Verrucomicrobiota bacterium]